MSLSHLTLFFVEFFGTRTLIPFTFSFQNLPLVSSPRSSPQRTVTFLNTSLECPSCSMHKRRKTEIASVFTPRPKNNTPQDTLAPRTPMTPSNTTSPPKTTQQATAWISSSPLATLSLKFSTLTSSVVHAELGDSDAEEGQHPTSIVGTPTTNAAFVNRVANSFGLEKDNHSNLHAFSKVYVGI